MAGYLTISADLAERLIARQPEALDELLAEFHATGQESRPARGKRPSKAEKREAKLTVRETVVQRANGRCENCGRSFNRFDRAELDHFWGRAKAPETTATTWLLCSHCHRQKTDEHPSRAYWIEVFLVHLERHEHAEGFGDQIRKAKRDLSYARLKTTLRRVAR